MLGSPGQRDMAGLERVQPRAVKMMKGLQHLQCEERQRALRLLSVPEAQRGSAARVETPDGRE